MSVESQVVRKATVTETYVLQFYELESSVQSVRVVT